MTKEKMTTLSCRWSAEMAKNIPAFQNVNDNDGHISDYTKMCLSEWMKLYPNKEFHPVFNKENAALGFNIPTIYGKNDIKYTPHPSSLLCYVDYVYDEAFLKTKRKRITLKFRNSYMEECVLNGLIGYYFGTPIYKPELHFHLPINLPGDKDFVLWSNRQHVYLDFYIDEIHRVRRSRKKKNNIN